MPSAEILIVAGISVLVAFLWISLIRAGARNRG